MVRLTFVAAGGGARTIMAEPGGSVMQAAVASEIEGILADCGGAMACATCHVHVDPAWIDRIGPPSDAEVAMLELAIEPDEHSRLSCQIRVTPALDGATFQLPPTQI